MSNFEKYNITPAKITTVRHRSECIPYYGAFWSEEAGAWSLAGAYLPLFASPMACVINDSNYLEFDKNGIIPVIPRTVSYEKRLEIAKKSVWISMGLEEFEQFIKDHSELSQETYVCVDIANGHMEELLRLCCEAKTKYDDNIIIMAGNVANPETYDEYVLANIDYIRVSIGTGSACLTNKLAGVGMNPYTLLSEIVKRKKTYGVGATEIVVDGGFEDIRDIIVALAIGADYVMCGKIFAQAEEACGKIIVKQMPSIETVFYPSNESRYARMCEVTRECTKRGRMYYGMSTERAQREMGNKVIKPAEGKEFWVPIEYTLSEWVKRFVAAISSTMSYCNVRTLEGFIGNQKINCS